MFIEQDSHRMRRFLLSGGFFIALLLLIKFNSSVVTMMDQSAPGKCGAVSRLDDVIVISGQS